MTYRALELLNLPQDEPAFLLDIGCGSGLSGEILDEAGYVWAGVDIAPSMLGESARLVPHCAIAMSWMVLTRNLEVALEREVEGDLFLQDIGQGFGFRPGSFDGAIRCVQDSPQSFLLHSPPLLKILLPTPCSISVLQWLLNAETSHPTSSPPHRLTRFFTTLHSALRNPSRAVLQFYPTSDDQIQLITSIAQRAGFGGGLVVDYPNSKKARKVFLCLFVGDGGGAQVPKGLHGDEAATESEGAKAGAKFERRRQRESRRERNGKQKVAKGGRDWILQKKDVRGARIIHHISLIIDRSFQIPAVPETRKGRCASRL
jgi:18S rRNA (guanine1575-N7)-methyltransferase